MNKSVKSITCLLLASVTAFSLVACKGSKNGYDTETRPVVFATEALDGNFNPFFATSGTDSEMLGMTQLGMMTTDGSGNILCGENEPTVALAYKETIAEDQAYTDYEFIIKNDIKFSDGVDLTIKDVLFNLYVYLDPAYMGSATLYSTDIVGLQKYRTQNPNLKDDESGEDFNKKFEAEAYQRRQDILDYLDPKNDTEFTDKQIEKIKADIETTKKLFREEVESDWTMNQGTQESYKDEYTFTEDWEIYYKAEGLITHYVVQGKPQKDKNGKYITNVTPAGVEMENGQIYDGSHYNESLVSEINKAMDAVSGEDARQQAAKEFAIDTVYKGQIASNAGLTQILTVWATATNILDKFTADARTEYFENLKGENGLKVKTIEGITTAKTSVDFNGKDLGSEHDVLKVRINKIDPKAIYNFSFAVAPMHYYSGTFNGVNYVEEADATENFGVCFNNSTFFETILKDSNKNKKPVGAGAYMVSNAKGETVNVDGNDFYSNNWVYFARNEHFTTVGDEIENAKIKYVRYKVVGTDKIIQALQSKDIDVGEPNATAQNITALGEIKHLNQKTVPTNGYGYVGVNPKYVPDIEVRQAIMKAMDTVHCLNYYTTANASLLYRSMSKESWVWDYVEEGTEYDSPYYELTKDVKEIQTLVGKAGWKLNSNNKLAKDGKTLKFTFTIAGATTDHPAYTMFSKAKEFLNQCGFDITVTTDVQALKKLATGQLEVWAAAWNSTIDPDMYQVYHKDSKATSVNNWGYPTILNDSSDQFKDEKKIINKLSDIIEEARETNIKQERSEMYLEALDLVMDLAVELPTYQRNDCVAYNKEVIDAKSLNQNPTAFAGVIDKIWELDYN